MKTPTTTHRLAAFGLAALPLTLHAQTTDADETLRLNPMVVTAALAPRTADETLASVTILDEATLERQDPTSITDLLSGQPGVDVTTNGSFGKNSSVYIRGTSSDQNVLLIDGIRLRSATVGSAAWQFLDPRLFERVEIVRGSRGSLYGADAVGGVVQLFIPEGEGGPTPRISAGGGSFDTHRYSASLSGVEGGTRYHFAASRFDTDGTPIRRDGEDKGFDNTSGLVRLSHTFDSGAEIGMLGLRATGSSEFDSFGMPANTDFAQQVAGIYGELLLGNNWRSRLTLSESRDEQEFLYTASESQFDTRSRTARWDNTLFLGNHELVLGADYLKDSVATTDDYLVDSRDNAAVFAQGLLDFAPYSVQASMRYDDNESYGEELTGSLALGYELDAHHTLRASYGTAFKAPSFNDLYYRDQWGNFGDPDLEPEKSQSLELGARGQYQAFFWDLALYQTDIDDLIDWKDQGNFTSAPEQVDSARIRGVELSGGANIGDWTLAAALTYTDPEDRETGNRLNRRASQSLRLDLDREMGDWSLGGSWIVQNHRYEYDFSGGSTRLGGFGLLNLRAGWQFAPLWSTRLTVENALDKEYETSRDYLNAGRAAFLSVHFGQ